MTVPGAASGAGASLTLHECALRGVPIPRLAGQPVIDNHCHLGPYGGFYQPRSAAADLVRTMDRIGIEQACVFSSLAIAADAVAGNDLSLAAGHEFPERLLPYAVPDPHQPPERTSAELQRCFDAGARGIKLHTQLASYPFDGPGYQPAFAFAHEHRLPLISHGVGSPDALRRIAQTYPEAHFIVAHAGASGPPPGNPGVYEAAIQEPNVYLDLTSSTGRFGAFLGAVQTAGPGKLVYGSDMPWMCASHQIGRVLLAPLPDEAKRLILGATMARLLSTRR